MDINFAGHSYLVLGAGVTGNSIARAIVKRGASVCIVDENPDALSEFTLLTPENVEISNFDRVVVSPGWNEKHPIIVKAIGAGIEIHNEVDIAWNISRQISPSQKWLALTGTNGKTTTVEMAAAMLQSAGLKAIACGNVGDTVIDAVDRSDAFD